MYHCKRGRLEITSTKYGDLCKVQSVLIYHAERHSYISFYFFSATPCSTPWAWKKRKFNIQTRALKLRCNLFLGLPVLSYLLHWPNTRAIIILQLTVWQQNDIHMNNMTWAKYLHSSRTKEISHTHYTSNIQYTIMTNESTENCHPAVKKLCHPWIIYDMNTRQ